ncbi:MAG: glycosyltransferase [Candidatus Paceibacterota bacterium]
MCNFCTLFDKNYLYRGLALYFSLKQHCPNFTLWILCLEEETYDLLSKMDLPKIKLIKMSEFEDERLLRVRPSRNPAEYAWTCTANLCHFMLKKEEVESITYLDADLYFFDNPEPIFVEIGNNSIGIIEHRFPKKQQEFTQKVGRFNVGFVYFKNDKVGQEAVKWWANKVIDWCFDRLENGLYGDQLYLNDWPERFPNLSVIQHPGAGLAPWNIRTSIPPKVIFYHFHAFKLLNQDKFVEAKGYFIPATKRKTFYRPYIEAIRKSITCVAQIDPNFNHGFSQFTRVEKLKYLLYNNPFLDIVTKNL